MNIGEFFTSMPSWVLFGVIVAISLLTTELGSWLGRRKLKQGNKDPEAPISTAVSAVLGLLAFMLGFTFSITASRFNERKTLVIAQANTLGEAYLRAGLAPEKQRTEIRKNLQEYTDQLLNLYKNKTVEPSLARMDVLHQQLWQQTIALEKENIDPEFLSLFITSINQIIQLSEERKTVSLVFRIPDALWTSLLLLTAMSMFAFGYQTGIHGRRRVLVQLLLPISFGMVIVLIADMDSIGIRRFQVSQEPLINLQKLIRKTTP